MEVNIESNIYQKIIDFIIHKQPEFATFNFKLKIIGDEIPSLLIILVEGQKTEVSVELYPEYTSLILYECSFHSDSHKPHTGISHILRLKKNGNVKFTKDGEEICYASLSSNRQILSLTLFNKENIDKPYSCFIINVSAFAPTYEVTKLYISQPYKEMCKIKFIPNPSYLKPVKSKLMSNPSFSKLFSIHIIFSTANTCIKYQRILISHKSAVIEHENILSTKMFYYDLKIELERLYIIEELEEDHFSLKTLQIIWPQTEEKDIPTFEFQLLFSYKFQLQIPKIKFCNSNSRILEHSNGTIAMCYEVSKQSEESSTNMYLYSIHLLNFNTIVECRTPHPATNTLGKIMFVMYKNYVVVFTKLFIHIVDIYCHSNQLFNYILPTCFEQQDFLRLETLNIIKLSKIYFLQNNNFIISVQPSLQKMIEIIKESNSVTQKVGALNFIVYNHIRKSRENIPLLAIKHILLCTENSFTMARLFDEYIIASINKSLRVKINQQWMMKMVDNTTLPSQISCNLSSIISKNKTVTKEDFIKINLKTPNKEALVAYVKEGLKNPQINRFLSLTKDFNSLKNEKDNNSKSNKKELSFINNFYTEQLNLPLYLSRLTFSNDQMKEMEELLISKFSPVLKTDNETIQGFIEQVSFYTIHAWKKLLLLIHKAIFSDDEDLWKDVSLFKRVENKKINSFHCALGAFRYVLLKEKLSIPSSIDEIYILISFNILSNERFLLYLTYKDFYCISNISDGFFFDFYKRLLLTPNDVVMKIKDIFLKNISMEVKMKVISILNEEDKDKVIREYWDIVHQQTQNFTKTYSTVIEKINDFCDTPTNALNAFYKEYSNQMKLKEISE